VISNGDKHSFKYGDARDNAAIRIFERTRDVRLEGNEITDARPGYEPVMRAPASKGN
jgi:hypothetical protein